MKVTPLDLRQQQFKTVMRGYDRGEVQAFLLEASDDYENALRENDKLRTDVARLDAMLAGQTETSGGMAAAQARLTRLLSGEAVEAEGAAGAGERAAGGEAVLKVGAERVEAFAAAIDEFLVARLRMAQRAAEMGKLALSLEGLARNAARRFRSDEGARARAALAPSAVADAMPSMAFTLQCTCTSSRSSIIRPMRGLTRPKGGRNQRGTAPRMPSSTRAAASSSACRRAVERNVYVRSCP